MSASAAETPTFLIIGENVHTTRIVRRPGPLVGVDDEGREAILFMDEAGEQRRCRSRPRSSAPRSTRRVVSSTCAAPSASPGRRRARRGGGPRLPARARRSAGRGGAQFLDVNVDEYSHRLPEQIETMRWLVQTTRADRRRPALDRLVEPRHHPRGHRGRAGARGAADAELRLARARSRRSISRPRRAAP